MPLKTMYDRDRSLYTKTLFKGSFRPEKTVQAVEQRYGERGVQQLLRNCQDRLFELGTLNANKGSERDAVPSTGSDRGHGISGGGARSSRTRSSDNDRSDL